MASGSQTQLAKFYFIFFTFLSHFTNLINGLFSHQIDHCYLWCSHRNGQMHFLFLPADYRHFYEFRQPPPWCILSPENGINLMKTIQKKTVLSAFWIYLLDLCWYLWQKSSDKGPVFFIESLHNVGQTLQPRLRGTNSETEIPSDSAVNQSRCSHLTLARCHSSTHSILTLFAGEEAFFRVSSGTTFSVSRFERTNDLHSSRSPPHISSSTRYAFFCTPGSLL